nr:DnaJ domain-containing protein [Parasaccharibacter sp. TMW 2.1891]
MNYYGIMELSYTASIDEIKKAWRILAKKFHPDVNKSPNAKEIFQKIQKAYSVLSDETKKDYYDKACIAAYWDRERKRKAEREQQERARKQREAAEKARRDEAEKRRQQERARQQREVEEKMQKEKRARIQKQDEEERKRVKRILTLCWLAFMFILMLVCVYSDNKRQEHIREKREAADKAKREEVTYSYKKDIVNKTDDEKESYLRKIGDGLNYYRNGSFKEAYFLFKEAADKGNAGGKALLGVMYAQGDYVPIDYDRAVSLLKSASASGSSIAQFNLGFMSLGGYGLPKDTAAAMTYFDESADNGDAWLKMDICYLYAFNDKFPRDYGKALHYCRLAADEGSSDAQNYLGIAYAVGYGVDVDYNKAVTWFSKAEKQGNRDARINLGYMYYYGLGVPQNINYNSDWNYYDFSYRKAGSFLGFFPAH